VRSRTKRLRTLLGIDPDQIGSQVSIIQRGPACWTSRNAMGIHDLRLFIMAGLLLNVTPGPGMALV